MPDPILPPSGVPMTVPAEAPAVEMLRDGAAFARAATAVGADGKPAYKSTEFWMSAGFKALCVGVMAYAIARGNDELLKLALECAGGNVVLYTIARTVAKRLPAPAATP